MQMLRSGKNKHWLVGALLLCLLAIIGSSVHNVHVMLSNMLITHITHMQSGLASAGNKSCTTGPGGSVLLSFQDLELQRQDHENQVWVAEADELTTVTTIARPIGVHASPAIKRLEEWLHKSEDVLYDMQQRARRLSND